MEKNNWGGANEKRFEKNDWSLTNTEYPLVYRIFVDDTYV